MNEQLCGEDKSFAACGSSSCKEKNSCFGKFLKINWPHYSVKENEWKILALQLGQKKRSLARIR